MKIIIRDRFRPFSHTPGASCLIPGSSLVVTAFPTRLIFEDLLSKERREISFLLRGPLVNFTLQQDLERDVVYIFGRSQEGFFRLRLRAVSEGVECYVEKSPQGGLVSRERGTVCSGEGWIESIALKQTQPRTLERLSLGNHKTQDVDQMRRRCDLKEVLPLLYHLGQKTPEGVPSQDGIAHLIAMCQERVTQGARQESYTALESLYLAGYHSCLVPRLFDTEFQGISFAGHSEASPCFLVAKTARVIRELFLVEEAAQVALLPCLPTAFESGRWVGGMLEGIGVIDFEWSRGHLRRVAIHATIDRSFNLRLQKGIKTGRVRRAWSERGEIWDVGQPLKLESGRILLLDHFQT